MVKAIITTTATTTAAVVDEAAQILVDITNLKT
jgi:hypothetical protein